MNDRNQEGRNGGRKGWSYGWMNELGKKKFDKGLKK